MFLSRNKKDNVYPCKPQFYNIKVGFKGVKIIRTCFRDANPVFWENLENVIILSSAELKLKIDNGSLQKVK